MQLLHLERDEGIHIIIVITVLLLQCHVQCGHVQIVNYSSTSCCYFRKLQMTLFINFLMLIIVCITIVFFSRKSQSATTSSLTFAKLTAILEVVHGNCVITDPVGIVPTLFQVLFVCLNIDGNSTDSSLATTIEFIQQIVADVLFDLYKSVSSEGKRTIECKVKATSVLLHF